MPILAALVKADWLNPITRQRVPTRSFGVVMAKTYQRELPSQSHTIADGRENSHSAWPITSRTNRHSTTTTSGPGRMDFYRSLNMKCPHRHSSKIQARQHGLPFSCIFKACLFFPKFTSQNPNAMVNGVCGFLLLPLNALANDKTHNKIIITRRRLLWRRRQF